MLKNIDIDLEYQPYISAAPQSPSDLYQRACASDGVTMNTWRDIWINNIKENHKLRGPFKEHGLGKLFHSAYQRPVICVGSGPSLKDNVDDLKDTKGMTVLSCLHNYHFLEDKGIKPDYYVTLDAGEVTIEEVSEGGSKTSQEYFDSTRDKKLIAFIGTSPKLVEKWQGEIYWYNAPIPDKDIVKAIDEVEPFRTYVSNGGNVLGACFYTAKAIMGANPIVFVGANMAFSYNKKFHGWASKYDKTLGKAERAVDVFGMPVWTWGSYFQFKCWFESRFMAVPGIYINATEGGILGAYPGGNIEHLRQMALSDVIKMYSLSFDVKEQCVNPETNMEKVILF